MVKRLLIKDLIINIILIGVFLFSCEGIVTAGTGGVIKSSEFRQTKTEDLPIVYQDESVKKIQEMQESAVLIDQSGNAENQANIYLEKNRLYQGWNDEKKIFIVVGQASFDSEDPSYDDSFITKRSLKTMEATLDAKAKIIEYIRSNMSVMDRALTPGTDLSEKFREKIDKMERKMEAQRRQVAKLLEGVDKNEAEVLRGATFGDRLNSLMDAAIEKLDSKYSTEKIEEKKMKKYEKAKESYQQALVTYKELEKKLEATTGTVKEKLHSKAETFSKMPLFGAVTVAQFESWNEADEQYQVTLIVLWSSKMERIARAFISGEDLKISPGKMSLREWIKSQNWVTATGGRRFRDNNGTVHFIGIAASPVGKSSSSEKKARGVSEMNAKKEVAMAIFADVESYKMAEQMMETRSTGITDNSVAAESFTRGLQQKIENRQIHGLQQLYGKKLIHPISQQKIYVTVYGVSSESVKQALLMQERNYLTRILDVKHQQKLKGVTDVYKSKVAESLKDKTEYNKSKAATSRKIENASLKQSQNPKETKSTESDNYQQNGGRSRSGTYSGGGNDSFDW